MERYSCLLLSRLNQVLSSQIHTLLLKWIFVFFPSIPSNVTLCHLLSSLLIYLQQQFVQFHSSNTRLIIPNTISHHSKNTTLGLSTFTITDQTISDYSHPVIGPSLDLIMALQNYCYYSGVEYNLYLKGMCQFHRTTYARI